MLSSFLTLCPRAHDMGERGGRDCCEEMQGPTDGNTESEQEEAQAAKRQRVQPSQQRRQPSQFQGSQQKLRAFSPGMFTLACIELQRYCNKYSKGYMPASILPNLCPLSSIQATIDGPQSEVSRLHK